MLFLFLKGTICTQVLRCEFELDRKFAISFPNTICQIVVIVSSPYIVFDNAEIFYSAILIMVMVMMSVSAVRYRGCVSANRTTTTVERRTR